MPDASARVQGAVGQYAKQSGLDYVAVGAGASAQALGPKGGAVGDYLDKVIISVATAVSAATSITDGSGSAIPLIANSPGNGIGVYVVPVGAISTSGAWKVTTGAGSTALAVGLFS